MHLEGMATWTRDKLAEFFMFIADKLETIATWIGQRAAWIGQKVIPLTKFISDLRAMDHATLFTVVKELTFGAVINAADVGTDIYTALSHYQLLVASDQMK